MREPKRAVRQNEEVLDQEHRFAKQGPRSSVDSSHAWEQGSSMHMPFRPRRESHSALLAEAQSDEQRASLTRRLQQTYGNSYVQRLLSSMAIQAKLTVNVANDIYEQEADRVADTVTRGVSSRAQRQEEEEELQMKQASELQRQEEEEELQMKLASGVQRQEEQELMQEKEAGLQSQVVSQNLEARINRARDGGQSLTESVRCSFEPQFERDLRGVRVHADTEADTLSRQLQAEAFTTGKDIFFRNGAYQPDTDAGKGLLAHELTHVVQQSQAVIAKGAESVFREIGTEGATETSQSVHYPVPLIPQPTPDSCWAGAMAMLVSYYQGAVTPEEIAETAGISLESCYGWDVLYAAARAYGLIEIPRASYTNEGWRDLLIRHGPLWVVESGDPSHAVVLTGISSGTVFINNPWPPGTGNAGPVPFQDFSLSFGGAADAVGENMQILHHG
ncbi:MAG: DUF4157 domain-containing protein [Dehalococcoidia bacterium]|jgi:hypothetical protein